jgi:hypothetical protein
MQNGKFKTFTCHNAKRWRGTRVPAVAEHRSTGVSGTLIRVAFVGWPHLLTGWCVDCRSTSLGDIYVVIANAKPPLTTTEINWVLVDWCVHVCQVKRNRFGWMHGCYVDARLVSKQDSDCTRETKGKRTVGLCASFSPGVDLQDSNADTLAPTTYVLIYMKLFSSNLS